MTTETANPPSSAKHGTLLVFQVAGQQYGLFTSVVEKIIPMAELQRPPGTPAVLAGFLDLAGDVLPVVHLSRLFGQPEAPLGLWTPLVVLRFSTTRLALLADGVHQAATIDERSLLSLPPDQVPNNCVQALARVENSAVLILSPERLLLEQETRAIADLRRLVQRRLDELDGVNA